MERRDADYLVYCAEGFLEALEEARVLALAGEVGGRLVVRLEFASDLLNSIEDGLNRAGGDPKTLVPDSRVRDLLNAGRGDPADGVTLH